MDNKGRNKTILSAALMLSLILMGLASGITITKTIIGTPQALPGDSVSYVLNVSTNNSENHTGLVVFDDFNTSLLTYTEASGTPNTSEAANGTISWTIDMNASQERTFTINFTANATGNITNAAGVDNSTGTELAYDEANITVQWPLTIEVENATGLEAGEERTMTINVTNHAPRNLSGITITLSFDNNSLNYIWSDAAANESAAAQGVVEWDLDINESQNALISLNLTATSSGNTTLNLTAKNSQGYTWGEGETNITISQPLVQNATISKTALQATATTGENISYLINVTNTGTSNLTNLRISDDFDSSKLNYTTSVVLQGPAATANTSELINGTVYWTINLTPTQYFTLRINFTTTNAGETTNNATATDYTDALLAQDNASVNISEVGTRSVSIQQQAVNASVETGSLAAFEIIITNTGTLDLAGLTVQDRFNESHLLHNSTSANMSVTETKGAGEVNWTFDLNASQSINITAYFEAQQAINATNDVYVHNSTAIMNSSSANVSITEATDPYLLFFNTTDLLDKEAQEGDTVIFTMDVANQGSQTWTYNFSYEGDEANATINPSSLSIDANTTGYVNVTLANLSAGTYYFDLIGTLSTDAAINYSSQDDLGQSLSVNVSPAEAQGPEGTYDLDPSASSISVPYVGMNQSRMFNMTIGWMVPDGTCADQLNFSIPQNYTYEGDNWTNQENYTLTYSGGVVSYTSTGTGFFCQGNRYFALNLTSNRSSYGRDQLEVSIAKGNQTSSINLSLYTVTYFSYPGRIFDSDKQPITNATAAVLANSFTQDGTVDLGTHTATTNSTGHFNITGIPTMLGTGGFEEGIFYQVLASQYNDTPTNHYGMYTMPSVPNMGYQEFIDMLWDLDIYLKPALVFHLQTTGYDYKSGPSNENSTCPGPSCEDPAWEPAFDYTNIDFSYAIKDKRLGYSVAEDWGFDNNESYVTVPRDRNYTVTIFASSGFPLTVDFGGITCNTTGVELGLPGVNATCTEKHGTQVVDANISTAYNMTTINGSIDMTDVDSMRIAAYVFEGGSSVFEEYPYPYNLGTIDSYPPEESLKDDYNTTQGTYTVYLPATEASSRLLLRMYVEDNGTHYMGSAIINSSSQQFSQSEIDFTLQELMGESTYTIDTQDVSNNWNSTTIVNSTAMRFSFVNESGGALSSAAGFIEVRRTLGGEEYTYMTDAADGSFQIPVPQGESFEKMTIYSQTYAPITLPVSAAVLNGSTSLPDITCSGTACNITLSSFDPFDPNNPGAELNVNISMYKSNETCDVPQPPAGCSLTEGLTMTEFSPFQAILSGDVSLRITSGDISVHYANTDLIASGPPDAAFSQNSTGSGLAAAWKFGSKGPEIYDEVIIGMPYDDALHNQQITIEIPLLYDNYFNVIWNQSTDAVAELAGTDYEDYLNSSYEAYLNGSGVVCDEADADLSSGLCYKDTANRKVWMRIPHFTGVGPLISGEGGTIQIIVEKKALNATLAVGEEAHYVLSLTNNGTTEAINYALTDAYDATRLNYTSANVTPNATAEGTITWNLTLAPNSTTTISVVMSTIAEGNASNTLSVNNGSGTVANDTAWVQVTADHSQPVVTLISPADNNVTSTATLTYNVSDTYDENVTCKLYVDAALNSTAQVAVNTTHNFTLSGPDADYEWQVVCEDVAGNNGTSGQRTLTLDATAPTTTTSVSGTAGENGWYVGDVQLSLSATDATSTTIYHNQTGTFTAYAGTITISDEGTSVIAYYAVDAAGNQEATSNQTVKIDKTSPSLTVTEDGTAGLNDYNTSNVEVTLFATDVHSGAASTEYKKGSGEWTDYASAFNITKSTTLYLRTTDNAGHTYNESRTYLIDKNAPTTTATMTGNTTNSYYTGNVTVTLTVEEREFSGKSGINDTTYQLDGGSWTDYTGAFTISGQGAHELSVKSTDNAGNVEQAHNYTVTIDEQAPTPTINSPNDGATINGTQTISINRGGADVVSLAWYLDGELQETTFSVDDPHQFTWNTALHDDGAHNLVFVATDAAGHQANTTANYTVDNTAPTLAITSPLPGERIGNNSINVTGTATGADAVYVRVDEGAWTEATLNDGQWWNSTSLAEGTRTISAYAQDQQNHTSEVAQVTISYDGTAPTLSWARASPSSINNQTAQLTITAQFSDANAITSATARLADGTQAVMSPAGGYYQATVTNSKTVEGSYEVTLTATDAYGNTLTDNSLSVELNNSVPTIGLSIGNGTVVANGTSLTISAANAANATYNVTVAGATSVATTALSSQATYTFNGSDGDAVNITVFANSTSGVERVEHYTYTIDAVAPVLEVDTASGYVTASSLLVSGNYTETRVASVTVDGEQALTAGSDFNRTIALAEGENKTITVTVTDEAGQAASATLWAFRDTTKPVTSVTRTSGTAGHNGWYVSDVTISFSATDDTATTTYYHNGTAWVAAQNYTFSEGTTTLQYRSVDAAGNQEANRSVQYRVDSTAPVVTQPLAPSAERAQKDIEAVTFTLNSSDAVSATITLTDPSGTTTTSTMLQQGEQFTYQVAALDTIGVYNASATLTDAAGNTVRSSTNVSVIKQVVVQDIEADENETVSVDESAEINTSVDLEFNQTLNGGDLNITRSEDSPHAASINSSLLYVDFTPDAAINSSLRWATIKLHYEDAGVDESTVRIHWYNASANAWVALNNSLSWVNATGTDTTNNYVWVKVSHFSTYGGSGERVTCNDDAAVPTTGCYLDGTLYTSGYVCDGAHQAAACDDGNTGGGSSSTTSTNTPSDSPQTEPSQSKSIYVMSIAPGEEQAYAIGFSGIDQIVLSTTVAQEGKTFKVEAANKSDPSVYSAFTVTTNLENFSAKLELSVDEDWLKQHDINASTLNLNGQPFEEEMTITKPGTYLLSGTPNAGTVQDEPVQEPVADDEPQGQNATTGVEQAPGGDEGKNVIGSVIVVALVLVGLTVLLWRVQAHRRMPPQGGHEYERSLEDLRPHDVR